jgi:hypothetical protein
MFVSTGVDRQERAMSIQDTPTDSSPITAPPRPEPAAVRPTRLWLRGALFLAGGAQLITISALVRADPLAVT